MAGKRKLDSDPAGTSAAGPSRSAVLAALDAAAPPAKRARKKKDPDTPPVEKRGAMFKKTCPKAILDRVDRVISQRFFMVDRSRVPGALREEFSVLGSTGNVYTVVIDKTPSCNCPDAMKGNHCKHILFIYLKVLQVSQSSGYWYQKALLTSELEDIFAHAPAAPTAVANARVSDAYARATGKAAASSSAPAADTGKKRVPGPDDDCPVCYDGMHGVPAGKLVWCGACGNALHKVCFEQWARTAAKGGGRLTCVWCRAPWVDAGAGASASASGSGSASGARRTAEGYLNLGSVAGVSPERDTSTYYQGPKKGRRYYGYQDYDF